MVGYDARTEIMATSPGVTVVGAGSWGTALARLLAGNGVPTTLWAREPEVAGGVNQQHRNPLFLTGVTLPESLVATNDLHHALEGADVVLSAVPTQFIRSTFASVADRFDGVDTIISVSKGIEVSTLLTPHRILDAVVGSGERVVALSGPSFAHEVASEQPTAVVAASQDPDRAHAVQELLSNDYFRVYASDDILSAELGGALKNVMAIATGIADGLGFGRNTRAALITRGLAEMTRLGVALGGDPLTFAGLSGLGDLVLTCTGDLSRNRRLGIELGKGRSLDEVVAGTVEVAEGVRTTEAVHRLSREAGVEMPIADQVYAVLYEKKEPQLVVLDLMGRSLRDERG